jgi:hypothetical protein
MTWWLWLLLLAAYGVCLHAVLTPEHAWVAADHHQKGGTVVGLAIPFLNILVAVFHVFYLPRLVRASQRTRSCPYRSGGGIGSLMSGVNVASSRPTPVPTTAAPSVPTWTAGVVRPAPATAAFSPSLGVGEQPRAQWCGQCGAALPGKARFCGQCGASAAVISQ